MAENKNRVEIFNQHRRRLFGIAYRMLGIITDAEDIVQEAHLRWHKTDAENIESPEAWLVTIVTRIWCRYLKLKTNKSAAFTI